MNTQQACDLLGVPIGASKEEVKKAFKKKAVELHPDRNQSETAENDFKEINEAYQLLDKYGTKKSAVDDVSSVFYNHQSHFYDELRRQMNVVFNTGFGFDDYNTVKNKVEPIIINVEVSFEESILGAKKQISYQRRDKCGCAKKVECPNCNGKGSRKYGAFSTENDRELPCTNCNATGFSETYCGSCDNGILNKEKTIQINIPPGVDGGLRLVLNNYGHYISGNKYGSVIAVIKTAQDPELQRNGRDVISVVELTLLEALKGTTKTVRTVRGEKTLTFKPSMKHRDQIRIQGYGVPPFGSHVFSISVNYPDNIDELIELLERS